ncbi:TetR/AcrR family transcriptional regulator [Streptomyces zaehneri]|uniref:TetR/AcrR family transcriptional regulator n=1 Tax=Streptomyces zaehneri TaxID=3051180 RepID=UPI0028D2BF1B|nr:TetR/AcrR family transcriptional regulator [Streptomyces sp. DSM 40713]
MPRPPAPHGRTGRPPVTSRTQILTAARLLIDRDGWEKLTIRRLAAELGIGATTLYHHFQNKEDLLVLLLNHYIDQIERPSLPGDPRERIVAAATAMHDALAAWPWAAEILTVDGFVGLLDESALWMVEAMVSGAGDHGCTPARAVEVFRSIWYYTVGEILVRAHSVGRQADDQRALTRETSFDHLDAYQVPYLAAIGGQWAALAARDTYSQGLRALVDGLLAQSGAPHLRADRPGPAEGARAVTGPAPSPRGGGRRSGS